MGCHVAHCIRVCDVSYIECNITRMQLLLPLTVVRLGLGLGLAPVDGWSGNLLPSGMQMCGSFERMYVEHLRCICVCVMYLY